MGPSTSDSTANQLQVSKITVYLFAPIKENIEAFVERAEKGYNS